MLYIYIYICYIYIYIYTYLYTQMYAPGRRLPAKYSDVEKLGQQAPRATLGLYC